MDYTFLSEQLGALCNKAFITPVHLAMQSRPIFLVVVHSVVALFCQQYNLLNFV